MSFDAAIIGAGIVGAACAAALSRDGLKVCVIEQAVPASGTTAAGMGHIVVMDDSPAQLALSAYSQRLWTELAPRLPAAAEFENCGTIWVAADDEELEAVRRKSDIYHTHGIASEILDERALREAEPNLREGLAGGLLVPSDSVVYQLFATRFLIDQARMNGCELMTDTRAVAIAPEEVALSDGRRIAARLVVNAAGTAACELSPGLSVLKRKGHLVITDRYPGIARHQLVELGYLRSAHGSATESVAFNLQPRSTGQVLLGSSRQFGVDDTAIDHAILRRMTERAFEYMPRLRDLSVTRVWTGFRPSTPDNLPYIGRLADQPYVLAAAGHEGLGITTALATAELIADEIAGRPSAISREPYSPDRVMEAH